MTPQVPARVVGRCIVCGDMIVEVVVVAVAAGAGMSVGARVVRRCGCGDFEPARTD